MASTKTIWQAVLFLALVALGAGSRIWLQDLPNFAPVAAIGLFAGFAFRSWLVAVAVPPVSMFLSDAWIGGYDPLMMLVVYAMLTLPVAARPLLRAGRKAAADSPVGLTLFASGLLASILASSLLFFAVTNLAWWSLDTSGMYDKSLSGLATCFASAWPFFRYTLSGDLTFGCLLFGGYGIASAALAAWGRSQNRAAGLEIEQDGFQAA